MKKLFRNLIKSNTGYNSKTFIMLLGVIITFILELSLIPLFYIAALNGLIVNWLGIAAVITSIATLAGVVIWGKVKTDVAEYENFETANSEENEAEVNKDIQE